MRVLASLCGLVIVLVIALAASGCGGSDDKDTSPASTQSTGTQQAGSAEIPETTWAINVRDLGLDVLSAPSVENVAILANVAQGLLQYDAYGKLLPALASSWKQESPTVYTYKLVPGTKFSDGNPVTMEDVLYSLRREMDPRTGPVSSIFFLTVKSIEAEGDDTVKVTLRTPDPTWQYTPGHYAGWIYEKSSFESAGSNWGSPQGIPIGTGPYKVTEFAADHVTFERNTYYKGPKPKAAKVVLRLTTDDATRLAALQSGDIDGTLFVPLADTPQWKQVSSLDIMSVPSPNTTQLTFNVERAPFDDVHARRAVMYAFNREGIVNDILHGQATVARTLISPEMWVNEIPADEAEARADEQGPQYEYDMDKAKEELSQSKYPNGFTAEVLYKPDVAAVGLAMQVWAESLKELGITLKLKEVDGRTFFQNEFEGHYNVGAGQGSFDFPDPLGYLPSLCGCHKAPEGYNKSRYDNPEFDALLNQAIGEPDHDTRVDAIMRALSIAARDVPAPTLWFDSSVAAVNKKFVLSNFGPWTWLMPWMANINAASS